MLPGFTDITKPLNKTQIEKLVPVFVKGLRNKIGKQNAVTSSYIISKIEERYNTRIRGSTVRKVINHIRNNNLLPGLIATSEGYYISNNPNEVKKYVQSLTGRINEITRVRDGMVEHLKKLTARTQQNLYQ